jgi:hypothetical protein
MDRELENTDDPAINDADLRGKGGQALKQQHREPDRDQVERDLSTRRRPSG